MISICKHGLKGDGAWHWVRTLEDLRTYRNERINLYLYHHTKVMLCGLFNVYGRTAGQILGGQIVKSRTNIDR